MIKHLGLVVDDPIPTTDTDCQFIQRLPVKLLPLKKMEDRCASSLPVYLQEENSSSKNTLQSFNNLIATSNARSSYIVALNKLLNIRICSSPDDAKNPEKIANEYQE